MSTGAETLPKLLQRDPGPIAIDTETTGLKTKDGREFLQGISLAWRKDGVLESEYFSIQHKCDEVISFKERAQLFDILRFASLVFFNAKFDLHSLATVGFIPEGNIYCAQLMSHQSDENQHVISLDSVSERLLKDQKLKDGGKKLAEVWGWDEVPVVAMRPYARKDAELTLRCFESLKQDLEIQELAHLWNPETTKGICESRWIRALWKIEQNGVLLDIESTLKVVETASHEMKLIEDESGFKLSKKTELENLLLVVLKFPIVKRTPGGKPSFDKEAMEVYDDLLIRSEHPVARKVAAYRGWQRTKAIAESYLQFVSPDHRLRPNFKIFGTKTSRLSCTEPNLQQIPRVADKPWNSCLKPLFIAAPGHTLVEFDYSNLEMRLAACYAEDQKLIADFNNNGDVHARTAQEVFGDGVGKRQDGKTLNFTVLYGGGIGRLSTVFGVTESAARTIRERFDRTYPGFRLCSKNSQRLAEQRRYVKLWTGRKRHFIRSSDAHKAFNSIIQGGAAELVKRAVSRCVEELDSSCKVVLTVHDSIDVEIPNRLLGETINHVVRIMTCNPEFPVYFGVEYKYQTTTGEVLKGVG